MKLIRCFFVNAAVISGLSLIFMLVLKLKALVLSDISKKVNYKKALRINEIFNNHLIEILSGTYSDYSATGFESFAKYNNNDEFIAFMQGLKNISKK